MDSQKALNSAQLADSMIPADSDPYALFDAWMQAAKASEPNDPNAMALATATPDGRPSVRMVLLKGHGPEEGANGTGRGGFTFFTNADSRKGGEIRANMYASLLFHWKSLNRQIRIDGPLEEVTSARADAYFHSRAFMSQVGSAASDQSRPMETRQDYLDRVEALRAEHEAAGQVPRPAHWTGFTLRPATIEFWMDRDNRLHDRRQFVSDGPVGEGRGGWTSSLLYP